LGLEKSSIVLTQVWSLVEGQQEDWKAVEQSNSMFPSWNNCNRCAMHLDHVMFHFSQWGQNIRAWNRWVSFQSWAEDASYEGAKHRSTSRSGVQRVELRAVWKRCEYLGSILIA
jgi:hypothetical protein